MSTVFEEHLDRGQVKKVQRALNELTWDIPNGRTALKDDGIFGPASISLLKLFQKWRGYHVTGRYNNNTKSEIDTFIKNKYITNDYIVQKSRENDLPPAMVFALLSCESAEYGFLPNSRAKILYERHIFYRYYSRKHGVAKADALATQYPNICNKQTRGYLGGEREWSRLEQAMKIDPEIALMSASFGLGQIMGFNFKVVGCGDIYEFFRKVMRSEYEQFDLMLSFILNSSPGMKKAMQSLNFKKVAEIYNGPAYARNKYDTKLTGFYSTFVKLYPN